MNTAERLEQLLAAFPLWQLVGPRSNRPGICPCADRLSRAWLESAGSLSNRPIVRMGIALFILLPILRVLLMLLVFIRERDFSFAFISGMVLAVILLGVFLGVPAT
jgi:hypothetical protein